MRKKLLLLILSFFCVASLRAEEIVLEPVDKKDKGARRDRTEIVVPSAEIENGIMVVETERATWGVSVTISDENGAVVYTAYDAMESIAHEFAVSSLPQGGYIIEIQIGEDFYEGFFSL